LLNFAEGLKACVLQQQRPSNNQICQRRKKASFIYF